MPTVRYDWLDRPPEGFRGGVVAIGNFDGVHQGHAVLLRRARDLANSRNAQVFAITFDPHPLQLLAPERFQPPLTTVEDRAELLHRNGADGVIILETTPGLLALGSESFCESILQTGLAIQGIVEGFNFRFGHNRDGDNDTLRGFAKRIGIPLCEVPAFAMGGVPVSSSRVRTAIEIGRIDSATELLGHRYFIRGIVVEGAKRGRTIGVPTANLDHVPTLLPGTGVYAVRVGDHIGAANIGPNPTFGETARKIEVHLLDFSGDLYGQSLKVEFLAKLRDTKKFESVGELVDQMKRDIEAARMIARDAGD